jgi:tRNA threonylcarbamoyl adenosine modification protein YeaZ
VGNGPDRVELSIDTAGTPASVALSAAGTLLVEISWRTRHNHSAELLPAIERALATAAVEREQIGAIFVDRGPGSYGGLRVGISTAMGLALALGADLLGVGRLELDAYAHAAFAGELCAVHQAGRGDLAWAVYRADPSGRLAEVTAPRLTTFDQLKDAAPSGALFCGELQGIEAQIADLLPGARLATAATCIRHAAALAELGWSRYVAGSRDNPLALEPLYLREPSITQPKERVAGPRSP